MRQRKSVSDHSRKIRGLRDIPHWVKEAVCARDGHACAYPDPRGRPCGRMTDLWYEQSAAWRPAQWWDPADFRLVCLYHMAGAQGLRRVDWARAPRA